MFLVCSWERYGQFCMYAACIGLRDTDIDLVFFFTYSLCFRCIESNENNP